MIMIRETSHIPFLACHTLAPEYSEAVQMPDGELMVDVVLSKKRRIQAKMKTADYRIKLGKRGVTNAAILWAVGLRCYYVSVCVASWVIGPIPCLVVTVVTIAFAILIDSSMVRKRTCCYTCRTARRKE
jgi:hypothetical protein